MNSRNIISRGLIRLALSIGLTAIAIGAAPAYAQKVAILAANGDSNYSADVRTKLLAAHPFSEVRVISVLEGQAVPTLATLSAYDAVLVYSDQSFAESAALGDVLASYVSGGGGLVVGAFAFTTFDQGTPVDPSQPGLAGQIVSGGFLPFTQGAQDRGNNSEQTLVKKLSDHPILSGVASFRGGGASFQNAVRLAEGATLVAEWSGGRPLVGVTTPGASRVVALNFYPPSADADKAPGQKAKLWVPTTDGARLMANALVWAKRSTSVTLTVDAASGPYGGHADLTAMLTLGSTALKDQVVSFQVDGTSVGSATTGDEGRATVSRASLGSIATGTHEGAIVASFAGAGSYPAATGSATLTVNKGAASIEWTVPASITYGTKLSSAELNATADVAGTFTYSPPAGTVLDVGQRELSVTFTPDDTGRYDTVTTNRILVVSKAKATLTWATPAPMTYPTPLSPAQLNATSSVPGTFEYSQREGAVLTAGDHEVSATFTPTDAANYEEATARVTITVKKATPAIAWANPDPITYGAALTSAQLNAAATLDGAPVEGTFEYSPAAGTVLTAGPDQTLTATFVPADPANYERVEKQVKISVLKATPVITWPVPEAITYGTPLSATQLNAVARIAETDVAGRFEYTPAVGTVLNAGADQVLSAAFVPADAANYNGAELQVKILVRKAVATVAAVGGTFTYTGSAHAGSGTATGIASAALAPVTISYEPGSAAAPVNAGTYRVVATFAGNDNYESATGEATITIDKAAPVVTAAGGTFTYAGVAHRGSGSATGIGGESLGAVTITYSPGGTLAPVNAGAYSVVASIPETANYLAGVSEPAALIVQPAPLVVQAKNETKHYGAPNPAFTVVFSGFVDGETAAVVGGTPVFTTEATDMSPVGKYAVTPGGLNAINYALQYGPGTLTVIYNDRVGHQFLQPVNLTTPRSSFKAGSTIPAKFQLYMADGVTPISTVQAEISVARLSSTSGTTINEAVVELPSDSGKYFRYDPVAQQYVYNLSTKGWTTGTYRITAVLGDGNPVTAEVEVRSR